MKRSFIFRVYVLLWMLSFTWVVEVVSGQLFRLVRRQKKKKPSEAPTISPTLAPASVDPLSLINYARLNVSKSVLDQIPCDPSPPCNKSFFLDYQTARSVMVDNRRKILMEYTPKAGCTAAVTMFMNEMGFVQNKIYRVWPHFFREEYFFIRCGLATPCMYESKDWYRFKVVRNPYDRIVSSYIHIMKYPVIQHKIIPPQNSQNLSFLGFLKILDQIPPLHMQGLAGAHVGYQSQPYERQMARKGENLFHMILYSENIEEGLAKINKATNSTFKKGDRGIHLAERHKNTNYFVGNLSWNLLKNKLPDDYGFFYNPQIKALVEKIYLWDIQLYRYSFPFKMSTTHSRNGSDATKFIPFHEIKIPEIVPIAKMLQQRKQNSIKKNITRIKHSNSHYNRTSIRLAQLRERALNQTVPI